MKLLKGSLGTMNDQFLNVKSCCRCENLHWLCVLWCGNIQLSETPHSRDFVSFRGSRGPVRVRHKVVRGSVYAMISS